jgi:hypothetical protein
MFLIKRTRSPSPPSIEAGVIEVGERRISDEKPLLAVLTSGVLAPTEN